jgi:hypothetical protein
MDAVLAGINGSREISLIFQSIYDTPIYAKAQSTIRVLPSLSPVPPPIHPSPSLSSFLFYTPL